MFGILKLVGRCIITGAAASAGARLWDDVLEDGVRKISMKIKSKMEDKKK